MSLKRWNGKCPFNLPRRDLILIFLFFIKFVSCAVLPWKGRHRHLSSCHSARLLVFYNTWFHYYYFLKRRFLDIEIINSNLLKWIIVGSRQEVCALTRSAPSLLTSSRVVPGAFDALGHEGALGCFHSEPSCPLHVFSWPVALAVLCQFALGKFPHTCNENM